MNTIPSDFPPDLTERLKAITADSFPQVCEAFSKKRFTTLRVNSLRAKRNAIETALTSYGIRFEHVPWYQDAFLLPDVSARSLSETEIYQSGKIYVQSLSSMLPVLILNPQKNEKILDITAAPGSKTTQMAAIMENTGEIIANDTSSVRREKLKSNLRLQAVTNTTVTNIPGQAIWQTYPEYFDKVLVDVPCSMEGRIAFQLAKTYHHWSKQKVKELSNLQKWILRSAVSSCRIGGVIVYSTCTLSPEENEMVVEWILAKESQSLVIENIDFKGDFWAANCHGWNNHVFKREMQKVKRVLPSQEMEGFFIAKFKKLRSNVPLQ